MAAPSIWTSSAATANVKVVSGDFNNDGRSDMLLAGGSGWSSIPVAFSNGDGSFTVTNSAASSIWTSKAPMSGVKVVDPDQN